METKTTKWKLLRTSENIRLCYPILFFSKSPKQRARKLKKQEGIMSYTSFILFYNLDDDLV